MRVVIEHNAYEMNRRQCDNVLRVAKKQLPHGIYAVRKGNYCELLKEVYKSRAEIQQACQRYVKKGFRVCCNE